MNLEPRFIVAVINPGEVDICPVQDRGRQRVRRERDAADRKQRAHGRALTPGANAGRIGGQPIIPRCCVLEQGIGIDVVRAGINARAGKVAVTDRHGRKAVENGVGPDAPDDVVVGRGVAAALARDFLIQMQSVF